MKNTTTTTYLLLSALILIPTTAQAACNFSVGTTNNLNHNFGTVTVQRDTPVGTTLAVARARGVVYAQCNAGETIRGALGIFTPPTNITNTYETNIPGIGIRVTIGSPMNWLLPRSITSVPGTNYGLDGNTAVELIKTSAGAVGSGNLNTGSIGTFAAGPLRLININLTGTSTISPVACSVTNTAINVPMGNVQRSTFTGVGYEGSPVSFNIPLDCDAGTRVNFKIDAPADSSNVAGVMAINSSATGNAASGVGIRIKYNTVPVAFGTAISAGTSASEGMYQIPLTAQYYQTRPNVTAGVANGTADFTMTYN